jgi:hypothetical protein
MERFFLRSCRNWFIILVSLRIVCQLFFIKRARIHLKHSFKCWNFILNRRGSLSSGLSLYHIVIHWLRHFFRLASHAGFFGLSIVSIMFFRIGLELVFIFKLSDYLQTLLAINHWRNGHIWIWWVDLFLQDADGISEYRLEVFDLILITRVYQNDWQIIYDCLIKVTIIWLIDYQDLKSRIPRMLVYNLINRINTSN